MTFLFINYMFEVLERIAFTTQNGLVLCDNWDNAEIVEILLLEEARKLGASAVLFRRYYRDDKEKSPYKSEPAVYIFEKENITDQKLLHAKIWSAGKAEVYIVLDKTNITIFNARRPAEVKDGKLFLDNLELLPSIALEQFNDQRFAAHLFGTGTFWEQGEMQANLQEKYNPYIHLLNYLMLVREKLSEKKNKTSLRAKTLDKILVLSILAKFLEEIKDDNGKHTLKEIYHTHKVSSFEDALRKGKTVAILSDLAQKLNGKIFEIDDEIEQEIKGKPLPLIADFLTGEIEIATRQGFLWKQYDFKYLPAEIISAIYENFIQADSLKEKGQTEKGVVYTPIHLVHLLIDELMPLDKAKEYFENESFKVLDPACGSGVFLVAAYKRMLQWWTLNHSTKESIQYPQANEAQRIMEQNIWGVDVQATATLVSIFGLTTALLEKLTPQQIWNDFQFNDLSKNIPTKNFFEWAVNAPKDFDLVIGNPPFNIISDYKKPKNITNKKDKKKSLFYWYVTEKIDLYKKKINFNYFSKVPDNLAFYFLEFARVLSPEKRICLIIPTTLLLYSPQETSINYRKALLENTNVEKIFDFTHLREVLFTKKHTNKLGRKPVCGVILSNTKAKYDNIEHIVIKRLASTENKTRFEIDHYDRHIVRYDWASNYPFVWKCNLLGGGRLFHLIYRLSLIDDLEQFIKNKQEENQEWVFGQGYVVGTPPQNQETIEYLYQQNLVSHISEKGEIIPFSDKVILHKNFEGPRVNKLYKMPLLLFHQTSTKGETNIPIGIKEKYIKEYLGFSSSFTGIHAPKEDFESLQKIYNRFKLHSETYSLWILANSSQALIETETHINKTDLETLPFPDFEDEEYLVLSKTEEILRDDVLNHYKHLGKYINESNKDNEYGYERLERKLDINRDWDVLQEFGKTFCDNLNEIYAKNKKSWQIGQIHPIGDFILYEIGFGKNEEILQHLPDSKELEKLVYDKRSNRGAIYTRNIRFYKHIDGYDTVFLLKPSNIRYWLRSVALRDAGDTFKDLKKGGK